MTETTHGMPNSRDTMTAWLIWAPTSTTTAAAGTNSGVQAGSVIGATRTSPGSSACGAEGSRMILARPVALPGQPGMPVSTVPAFTHAACGSVLVRRDQVDRGGTVRW